MQERLCHPVDRLLQAHRGRRLQHLLPRRPVHRSLRPQLLPALFLGLHHLREHSIELHQPQLLGQLLLPQQLLPRGLPRQLLHRLLPPAVPTVLPGLPDLLWTRARRLLQVQLPRQRHAVLPTDRQKCLFCWLQPWGVRL